ncbi:hypothetical protein HHX47_DHR3000387 [Lentinula edodes]|nr:hypothetical protein HHX47_DHR3000387 [Lentinula edodes]
MLPLPVSQPQQRSFHNKIVARDGSILPGLQSRARITNLSLILLSSLAFFSVVLNMNVWISRLPGPPNSILSTLNGDRNFDNLDHLIIVPGHAIWNGASAKHRLDENLWTLEPYQKNSGRVEAFYQHISYAGQTRQQTTTTEAESYHRLAMQANLLPPDFMRATTENYALDSYQNLLFSIARFHEYTGVYPAKITVIGYEMKRKRFIDLHREAVRWSNHRFEYIGIDNSNHQENVIAQEGELLQKRMNRNHHRRYHPYHTSSPELSELLEWCPAGSTLYNGMLPWTE